MKKQIFFTLFVIFLGFGCKKDITSEQQTLTTTTATSSVDEKQMVKDQAEAIGKTAYRHLKFYFTQKKAEDYVNPLIRTEVMASVAKAQAEYKDLTAEETIQKAEMENKISMKAAQAMRDLITIIKSSTNFNTMEGYEASFKSFENNVYNTKELTSDEKFIIAGSSTTIRSITRFSYEMIQNTKSLNTLNNNIIQTRTAGCIAGRKEECYINSIVKLSTTFLTTIIKAAIIPNTAPAAVAAAFIVGTVEAIIGIFGNDACKCGESPGCFQPTVINPVLNSNSICNPYIGFVVAGTGTIPTEFRWSAFWTDTNGVEHAILDVQNKLTTGPALAPFPIPDPNVTIKLQLFIPSCSGQPAKTVEFFFKVNDIIGNPGSVFISGPSQVSLNSTGTFTINGDCLLNPNNNYSWNQPSAGVIVSGGNTSVVNIKFTTRTCYSNGGWSSSCFPVYVIANSTNPCSMLQSGNAKSVTVP
jgi:hypothetical protein